MGFGLQGDVRIESIHITGACARHFRGAIQSESTEVVIERAILLQYEDDVLDWAGAWRWRCYDADHSCLRDSPSRPLCGRCVGRRFIRRYSHRPRRQLCGYVANIVVDDQVVYANGRPTQRCALACRNRVGLGREIDLHRRYGDRD